MALTMVVVGGAQGHSWRGYVLCGLITLPAWVVLFKVYGLYERDAKRLSHSTLDDLPSLFHCLLLGCLLTWCWFVVAAPTKLRFTAILTFGALAMVLVLAGRALARAGFLRLVSPERVLLIGTGKASGALIEKMRATASLGLHPIGMVSCDESAGTEVSLPRLGPAGGARPTRAAGRASCGASGRRRCRAPARPAPRGGSGLQNRVRSRSACCRRRSVHSGPAVEVDDVRGMTVLGNQPAGSLALLAARKARRSTSSARGC